MDELDPTTNVHHRVSQTVVGLRPSHSTVGRFVDPGVAIWSGIPRAQGHSGIQHSGITLNHDKGLRLPGSINREKVL